MERLSICMKVLKETGQHNAILSKQDIEELQNYLNYTRRIDRITEKGILTMV